MNNWDELKTAYKVAQLGTVTEASKAMGVHRATVIRHIDSLEAQLGVKLFQRHGRGYTPTEMGWDLLQVASLAESEFSQFEARAQGSNTLHGEFVVTSLEFIAPFVLPALKTFQKQNPDLSIRYLVGTELLKLEYGQAHIAIRSGEKPTHPDYVVKPFINTEPKLFAHKAYIAERGMLAEAEDINRHQFVMVDESAGFAGVAINQWLAKSVSKKNIVLTSNSYKMREEAILHSMGVGVMYAHEAKKYPELLETKLQFPNAQADNTSWIVTHGDLHRTEKVQRFLNVLNGKNEI